MFEISTFRVFPSGKAFHTSLMCKVGPQGWRGDRSHAYYRAHLYAAHYAAEHRSMAYVTRDDRPEGQRMGFGSAALFTPTTVLYQIIQLGLGSYFDYNLVAWVPFPAEAVRASQAQRKRAPVDLVE